MTPVQVTVIYPQEVLKLPKIILIIFILHKAECVMISNIYLRLQYSNQDKEVLALE